MSRGTAPSKAEYPVGISILAGLLLLAGAFVTYDTDEDVDTSAIVEPELPRLDCELGAARIALALAEHRTEMAKLNANGEPSARGAMIRSGLAEYLFIADVVFSANDNTPTPDVVEAARAECRRRSA